MDMWRRSLLLFAVVTFGYFTVNGLDAAAEPPEHVKRGIFTFGIEEREPINDLDSVSTDSTRVVFFTELVELAGTSVTHRWVYEGETMAEVPFQVGGARWRVYSSKKLLPEWTGEWKVQVVDAEGITMYQKTFLYHKPE